ncbi:MAG: hypothetical protein A3H28_09960 [Acidobacteria bacterium RIFCSPLOWO2_02_FULL_61_28]|nr:MAG: hypothetical protein A3H28_09960 [Acidobacteria bacterium RIFCSPLOWO2_02_FULL_61_28]
MNNFGKKVRMVLFLAALMCSYPAFTGPAAAQNAPSQSAWNMESVGAAQNNGRVDVGAYSKLTPWPDSDNGQYLYSGCYDPSPLATNPGAAQCFMTVSLKDPNKPERLATVYIYDLVASPAPPLSHAVWKSADLALLPVKAPCDTFKDPAVLAGTKRPACWDPGWNTHTHYVAEGPGKILAVNEERRRGGGTTTQANYHGVSFYDVSDPAKPVFLSRWQAPVSDPVSGQYTDSGGTHHFNFRNQGQPGFQSNNDNRYLFLGTWYKGYIGMILVILDVRDPRRPVEAAKWHIPGQRTPEEDAQRNWVHQGNFSSPVRTDPATGKLTKHVAMHYPAVYGNIAYLSYRQAGLVILDVADIRNPKFLSRLDYLVPGFEDPTMPESMKQFPLDTTAFGNAHSAKLVPGQPNLLWLTDEYFSCPYGHLRMVDVADPKKPRIISHFLYPENTACDPANPGRSATPARFPRRGPSTHLGNARDGLLYLAWYGMCARVINIKDPSRPVEAGRYTYQIDPSKPEFAGCDTYDVIFGPNGLLYVSDGTAGLRVVKYTGESPGAARRP